MEDNIMEVKKIVEEINKKQTDIKMCIRDRHRVVGSNTTFLSG